MKTKVLNLMNGELEVFYGSLLNMSAVKLPMKISNIILETVAKAEPHLTEVSKKRASIIDKYCKKENGNPVLIAEKEGEEQHYDFNTEEEKLQCTKEVNDLMGETVSMIVREIDPSEIMELENVKPAIIITPGQADLLWAFTNKTK